MIRRKLLIATAIIASVGITACSDMTAPKKLVPGGLAAAAIVAPPVTVFARINGGGTAEMQAPLAAGDSKFGTGVTLYSDHTASGSFDCVDQHGDAPGFPGNIFGEATSWSMEGDVIVLTFIGKLVVFPGGHPQATSFTVKIQKFGGAGVGHWTLQDTASGFIFCYEILTSGQIVIRYA
jgi:hypothetical protein